MDTIQGKSERHPYILTTSSTMMGFCFVVLTSVNNLKKNSADVVDVMAIVAIALFAFSCLLSFFAMRSTNGLGVRFEKTADFIFLMGLATIFGSTVYFTFNVFK